VGDILEQLELNKTFLIQFAIFGVLFLFLANVYFKPFMKLFDIRHKRTVEDREAAEKMVVEADARFEEYKKRIHEERVSAKKEFEEMVSAARKEEASILAHAREEAKKITQEASDSIAKQREQLKKQIEVDVESLATGISERLLAKKL
jgi:F0F1-type ATP synthase membrane subunit b/b'